MCASVKEVCFIFTQATGVTEHLYMERILTSQASFALPEDTEHYMLKLQVLMEQALFPL